jgi:hypothetical protein
MFQNLAEQCIQQCNQQLRQPLRGSREPELLAPCSLLCSLLVSRPSPLPRHLQSTTRAIRPDGHATFGLYEMCSAFFCCRCRAHCRRTIHCEPDAKPLSAYGRCQRRPRCITYAFEATVNLFARPLHSSLFLPLLLLSLSRPSHPFGFASLALAGKVCVSGSVGYAALRWTGGWRSEGSKCYRNDQWRGSDQLCDGQYRRSWALHNRSD